jgi:hypothetical protein
MTALTKNQWFGIPLSTAIDNVAKHLGTTIYDHYILGIKDILKVEKEVFLDFTGAKRFGYMVNDYEGVCDAQTEGARLIDREYMYAAIKTFTPEYLLRQVCVALKFAFDELEESHFACFSVCAGNSGLSLKRLPKIMKEEGLFYHLEDWEEELKFYFDEVTNTLSFYQV